MEGRWAGGVALLAALVIGTITLVSCEDASNGSTAQAPPAKWTRVFSDHFNSGFDKSKWGLYSGQPAGDPGGWWEPSHVVVRNGRLNLRTYRDRRYGGRWVSGGLSSARALKQTYGKYEIRMRVEPGRGVAAIMLLWPVEDHWPPEIDFAENGGTTRHRRTMTATLHYGAENNLIQRKVAADFTRWHRLGVEWTPGKLVYTLDGKPWGTVRSRHAPSEPMELALQTQAGTCGHRFAPCPNSSTPRRVDMQVDWVVAHAYSGLRP